MDRCWAIAKNEEINSVVEIKSRITVIRRKYKQQCGFEQIIIPHSSVSRVHCVIQWINNCGKLINYSKKHTCVNRITLEYGEQYILKQQNIMQIGQFTIVFNIKISLQKSIKEDIFFGEQECNEIKLLLRCNICFEIVTNAMRAYPCGHSFCEGCLSRRMNLQRIECDRCERNIIKISKDELLRNVVDNYLIQFPIYKHTLKSKKENNNNFSRQRQQKNDVARCQQCYQQKNGFKCENDQTHVICKNCKKYFPLRKELKNQNCAICNVYLCNLYLKKCQVFLPRLMPLELRKAEARIDKNIFRNNIVEMQMYSSFLFSKKTTVLQLFQQMLLFGKNKQFYYNKINKQSKKDIQKIEIDEKIVTCDSCWKQLWFQMLIFYNKKYKSERVIRPDCHWGFNCRSMQHNIEHAKKYNHLVEQSKYLS